MFFKKESRQHFWSIILVMMLVGAISTIASIGILYQSAVEAEKSRLISLVSSKARLINAVAVFDSQYSRIDHPQGAIGATLSQIQRSFELKNGFGKTGEFVVGRLNGSNIDFLMSSRDLDHAPEPIAIDDSAAEPMRRALNNQSGTIIDLDYQSRRVLAAYQPIPVLNLGIVAKIEMSEVQEPFVDASINAMLLAIFIIVLGTLLITQIEDEDSSVRETFALRTGTSTKEWLIYRSLLLAAVAFSVMISSIGLLYQYARDAERGSLLDLAETQASLINAVADFDAKYNDNDFPGGAIKATLKQVISALQESPGFGESGEYLLGSFDEYQIIYLTQPRHSEGPLRSTHVADPRSNAMKQALAGRTGMTPDIDYRDVRVLAAYTPIPKLKAGLVAKIDVQEMRKPFIQATSQAGAVSVVAIGLGSLFLWHLYLSYKNRQSVQQDRLISQGLSTIEESKISVVLILFTLALGVAFFSLDMLLPLGVACGLPYIFFVLTGKLFPRREYTLGLALIATILVYVGYHLSPEGGQDWVVITNRILAVVAIWLTAITVSLSQAQNRAQKIQASELRKLSLAVEHSPASVIITDPNGMIQYVNQKYTELTGFSREESVGHKSNMTRSGNTSIKIYQELWETLQNGQEWYGEFQNRKKSGELYWERASIHPITSASGKIVNYVALQEDITERKEHERELKYHATHDTLTSLPTRSLCMDRLSKVLDSAKRKRQQAAVLFIDLDGFKDVNDNFGHDVGDKVLIETAERLRSSVRESDTVARIGGDEFLILLNEITQPTDASLVAKTVLDRIENSYLYDDIDEEIHIGVSIGISIYPDNALDPEELIQLADKAMYCVKTKGKNNFSYVERDM